MYRKTSKTLSFLLVFAMVLTNLFSFGLINTAQAEDGDGTWDNPYTVAQAITIQDYSVGSVIGYVVGQPTAENTVVTDSFPSDYAIAIADTQGETDTTKMLYIKVETEYRPQFGLKSNPNLMGKQIKATGNLTAYFTPHPGLINITAIEEVSSSSDPIPVTNVTLDQETATVEVGRTTTLTATVEPADATNKTITWSSSDDAIATVAGGTVTAVAAGTATITVTTEDQGITDTCEVIVTEAQTIDITTIAEARVLPVDTEVTIEGIVTADLGDNIYIQDETAGILVRLSGLNQTPGDKIRVKGTIGQYYGMAQIYPASEADVTVVEAGVGVPAPQLVTSTSLGADTGEAYEGELVKIENVTATAVDDYRNFTIQDVEGTTKARPSDAAWMAVDTEYSSITGVVTYDFGEYKIYPRTQDDIVAADTGTPQDPELITIAEARETENGQIVTISGIVTGIIGNNAFIQDDTAGIYLYTGSAVRAEFVVGNELKIKGAVAEYSNLKQISSFETIEVLSTDNQLPQATNLTIGQVDEAIEGQLVKLTNVEVISVPSTESSTNYSVRVSDGTNQIDLRVDKYLSPGIPSTLFNVEDIVTVTAPVGQYYDNYQLMLRSENDVVVKEDTGNLAADLFISEYIEGSSNNKAIEIFNGTGAPVDLSTYTVELYSNGSPTAGNTLTLSGTLANGDVFVIVNAGAVAAIKDVKDIESTVTYFNGDDALVLKHNGEIIDVFGQVGFDPGSVWGTGDITTGEHTLVRKGTITAGDVVSDDAFDPALEWDAYPQDTFDYLGSHTMGDGNEEPDTIAPTITHTPVTSANIVEDITLAAQVTDDRNIDGVNLYYRTVGDTEYNVAPMTAEGDSYTAIIPTTELSVAGLQYYIEASDGTNTATSPQDITTPYEVAISDEDITPPTVTSLTPSSGSSTGTNLRPEISAGYSDASGIDVASIELYVDEVDVTDLATITETMIIYIPDTDLAEGNHTVRLVVSDLAATPQTAIVEWNFYAGEREYNLYFGQLHSHTNISDGQGTLDDAYTWARDEGQADFFAVTDHSNWFDNEGDTSNETITDISQSTSNEWKQMNSTADSYNVDGEYVAIAGFEMTWSGSTGGWGHINTFNTPWFASRSNGEMDLPAYYSHISADTDSLSQLNHPGTTFGDFADFGYYSEAVDNVVHLIEVGNGEGEVGSSGYFPSYEYYTRALDKGWHVAPSNNQDNHLANWITANDARTVVLGSELTREGIFDGIRNLRVYSTEDKNLEIMYKVNDNIMGSTLDNPEALSIYIEINDPDETDIIGKVSIIADGGTEVASQNFNDNQALWELELDPQYSYYYVRIDQADDEIAVTAPVWTSEVTPVGISKVEVSQDPQIVNNPIDITAAVYNNSASTINNINVEFYKDSLEGAKIGEATITSIEPGYSGEATIEWSSDSVGKYNIYAKTTINVDGGDKIFTGSTSVTFANPEDVTKVVLDMAHYNAYVSGDYAGKDLTLREMFKDRGYMLVENWDELTAEDLANAQLLIITDPQSTDNTTYNLEKSLFTDAEVAAIKGYTDNGGDLIICSKADYGDGVGEYSNGAQLNKILEAVGTNLRVNDDEVADYTNNGGQFYRLYFDRYISTKYNLTDNIPEGTTYSFYSGCSVILKDGGNEEAVDWLVQGHETTGTIDADDQDDNVPVEEGNVYVIGAEEISSGAKVIVAGSVFFSDFETASSDNMYSNKQITENILDWMIEAEEVELKTIAEVRADEDNDGVPDLLGQRFAVEGRVTAQSEAVTPKNAFFEVIYVQDETGGITVFGVSTTPLPLGTKVRVTGTVDQYNGDTELSLENETNDITIIDSNVVLVEPIEMTTGDSMLEDNEGWLVKVEGIVTRMTDNSLFLDDGTGEARVFIDGYIGDGTDNPDMLGSWDTTIKVGDTVSAIGLASEDPDGHRLRVRNTGEIVKVEEWVEPLFPIEVVDVNITDIEGNEGTLFDKGDIVIVNTAIKNVSRNDHSGVVVVELLDDHGKIYGTTMICEDLFGAGEDKEYTLAFEMTGLKKGIHTARVYVVNNLVERKMISQYSTTTFPVEFGTKASKK